MRERWTTASATRNLEEVEKRFKQTMEDLRASEDLLSDLKSVIEEDAEASDDVIEQQTVDCSSIPQV